MKKSEILYTIESIPSEYLTRAVRNISASNPNNALTMNRASYDIGADGTCHVYFASRATKDNMLNVLREVLDEIVCREGIDAAREILPDYTPEWYEETPAETDDRIIEAARQNLAKMSTRSAWDRGVNEYAGELIDSLAEALDGGYFGPDDLASPKLVTRALLNGAQDWVQYSWSGCSLVYDQDIATRLCTPSELQRTRCGDRKPNAGEDWLDTQARALRQAARRVCVAIKEAQS